MNSPANTVADGVNRGSQSLFDAGGFKTHIKLRQHLFALRNPLQEGVLLADEIDLGKTIEAGLVLCQLWAEAQTPAFDYLPLPVCVSSGRETAKI